MSAPTSCKQIDGRALVAYIAATQAETGRWVCVWDFGPPYSSIPPNLMRAKLGGLLRKGLLTGCNCGCRGDYEITDKGAKMLAGDL